MPSSAPQPLTASEHDRALALWVLSRPWDPPRWQRRICEAVLAAPVAPAQLGLWR